MEATHLRNHIGIALNIDQVRACVLKVTLLHLHIIQEGDVKIERYNINRGILLDLEPIFFRDHT